jgi:lysine biosynthesis protein LysW
MATAICPSCGEDVKITGQPKIGQEVICPHCEDYLEVIEVDPVELNWSLDEEWEDDWEDEEELTYD